MHAGRCALSLGCRYCAPYALLPFRGPSKYHKINPSSGSSTTAMIQINFFSLETELCKILMIAQISPASISRPQRLLYPMFIF